MKCTKLMCNGVFHSKHCFSMFCSVNIWSIHPLSFLKPACYCLSLVSTTGSVLLRRTLQNTLLEMDKRPFITFIKVFQKAFGTWCSVAFLLLVSSSICCQLSADIPGPSLFKTQDILCCFRVYVLDGVYFWFIVGIFLLWR